MIIVMCGRKVLNLGGQDRRWLKVAEILTENQKIEIVINESYFELAKKTELNVASRFSVIAEKKNKYFDYLLKNLKVIFISLKHKNIHYCGNALELTPSAFILRVIFFKKVTFSFNGVSVNYLKSTKQNKSVFLLRVMSKISSKIEILNPQLINENFFCQKKLFISKPMYAGTVTPPVKMKNHKKIVFCGHLYNLKGIDTLRKIIATRPNDEYKFYIYGDLVDGYYDNKSIQKWKEEASKISGIKFMSHVDNMSHVYNDALVVLSLQTISNYPSQVVIESLNSGTSTIVTDTGDSKEFGCLPGLFYVNPVFSSELYWKAIIDAADFTYNHHTEIISAAANEFSPKKYVDNFLKNIY